MVFLWLIVLFLLVALVQMRDRLRRLEETISELRHLVERLTRRVEDGTAAPPVVRSFDAPPIQSYQPPARPEPVAAPVPTPRVPTPEVGPARTAAHVTQPVAASTRTTERPIAATPPFTPPPPPREPPGPRRSAAPEPARPKRSFDLESIVGVKLFAIVAAIALFLAGS